MLTWKSMSFSYPSSHNVFLLSSTNENAEVWPMIKNIYVISLSSLSVALQAGSRMNTWSLFQRIYTLYSLHFENVTCRTEIVYICWLEKACFFLIHPIIMYLYSPQPMRMQQGIINWFVWKEVFLFLVFDGKGHLHKVWDYFSFILCPLLFDNTFFFHHCSLLSKNTCFAPFMQCSLLLKNRACIFLFEIFVSENGKELDCRTVFSTQSCS